MVSRDIIPKLKQLSGAFPAVTVTGPRQSGKTTLCRAVFADYDYVSLEAPDVRAFAAEDPRAFLAQFADRAILDEVQRTPHLLSFLQGLIDDDPRAGRWILTGSHTLQLSDAVSQTLAGRTAVMHLLPLAWPELTRFARPPRTLDQALYSGSYPRIFDAGLPPTDWLQSYVRTYVERDVRLISGIGNLLTFQRFLGLCAGRTSQLLNYSSLASDCSISQPTARAWISLLEASFLVFRLPPFHGNMRKRLVRAPKLHFLDTGLVCWLLGIRSPEQLRNHPLRGPIFESWVVSECVKWLSNQGLPLTMLSHYRDRNGAEADLVVQHASQLTLMDAKSGTTPSSSLSAGLRRVVRHFESAALDVQPVVVYGGESVQRCGKPKLVPWKDLHTEIGATKGWSQDPLSHFPDH